MKMSEAIYPKVYLYQRIVQAKLYIDSNYADKIAVDNISDEACLSKFHFIRLFKKIYGKTPHQYLTSVRIEMAMKLLCNGIPPTDVCVAVGFESLSSFGSLFKRIAGISPSDFMQEQQKTKRQIQVAPFDFIPACFIHQHGWAEK